MFMYRITKITELWYLKLHFKFIPRKREKRRGVKEIEQRKGDRKNTGKREKNVIGRVRKEDWKKTEGKGKTKAKHGETKEKTVTILGPTQPPNGQQEFLLRSKSQLSTSVLIPRGCRNALGISLLRYLLGPRFLRCYIYISKHKALNSWNEFMNRIWNTRLITVIQIVLLEQLLNTAGWIWAPHTP
jgi:hypothetical protein